MPPNPVNGGWDCRRYQGPTACLVLAVQTEIRVGWCRTPTKSFK